MDDQREWRHGTASVDGLSLHYVEAGPEDGPLVLLLHGFPEHWYAWRHQLPALAAAGYHAVAPDMRGYNRSDKPPGVDSYRIEALVGDVVGLVRHFGAGRAAVVGHDWGGLVAWEVAIRHPEVVDRLVALNMTHPDRYRRALASPVQLGRSWYAALFQLPWLPERLLRAFDFAAVRRLLRNGPANPDAFDDETVERYVAALSRPGALTAALDYYRAYSREVLGEVLADARPGGSSGTGDRRVTAPTLLVWGERDPALDVRLTEGLDQWVPDLRVERLPEASHWVQADAPERVNELLLEFLSRSGRRTPTRGG